MKTKGVTDFALLSLESKRNPEAYIKHAGSEEHCNILMDLLRELYPKDSYLVVRKPLAEQMLKVRPVGHLKGTSYED